MKITLFTLTTVLLLFNYNCKKSCKDGKCLTDKQVQFFSEYIYYLDTKYKLYEAKSLNLSDKSITSFDTGIFNNLTKLTWLQLYDNQLASIPKEIGNLTSLTRLDLSNNDLASLPAGIFDNLTSLRILNLSNNQLTTLPSGIFSNLTKLTALSLKISSVDTNSLICNDTNYTAWGLDTTSLPTIFSCNN